MPKSSTKATAFIRDKIRGRIYATRRLFKMGRLPNALIIGTMKGGTTSLFEYLGQHPNVCTCVMKEPQYFDSQYNRGVDWYRSWFWPKREHKVVIEASPHILFHPLAPRRVHEVVPSAKLIVALREPVARAYSHYRHWIDLGYETLSFREALDREASRTADLEARLLRGEKIDWLPLRNYSYVGHGRYATQIERWLSYFPRDQMLFLKSEEMFDSPRTALDRICRFLGLPKFAFSDLNPHNQRQYSGLEPKLQARLASEFAASNDALECLTGIRW